MIGGPTLRTIGLACMLDEAVRRFNVAAFGDVPSGSYIVKGRPAKLPKQVKDGAVRERVYDLLQRLGGPDHRRDQRFWT